MYLVGVTGGIASGKSTVITMIKDIGVDVIDADLVAREVVMPGKPAWRKIKEEFGDSVIQENQEIDRPRLAAIIFSDANKRRILNQITHPEVYKSILFKCLRLFLAGHPFIVIDLPLLFESGYMTKFMSKIIVVKCTEDQQLHRLMTRNNFTTEEAETRISAQMSLAEKCMRASYVVDNSGAISVTRKQVEQIISELKSSNLHWKIRLFLLTGFLVTASSAGFLIYKLFTNLFNY